MKSASKTTRKPLDAEQVIVRVLGKGRAEAAKIVKQLGPEVQQRIVQLHEQRGNTGDQIRQLVGETTLSPKARKRTKK